MNRSFASHNMMQNNGQHQSTPQMNNFTWGSASQNQFQPHAADIVARRSISDSVLQRGCPPVYNQKNTAFMLISRSGGSTIKQIIDTISARLQQATTSGSNASAIECPSEECRILANFTGDAYYNVVITGRQGVQVLIRAMQTWSHDRGLQECCCLALSNLCLSGNNVETINQAGGVAAIIQAMRTHATSVAVQSAACDALRNMSGLIEAMIRDPTSPAKQELEARLTHAKDMYLLPVHRGIAEALLQLVQQHSNSMI